MAAVQSEVNIGMVGHVDHGKTTLTKALTGIWTDKHSEEIRRGISIRLGYADCDFYKCENCPEPDAYTSQPKCPACGGTATFLRRVSFVDSPGHETLMATMLSGAAIMDGAVLVIAANEECPQPQTAEHLTAIDSLGITNVVIAQNKIDLLDQEKAKENYRQIREFIAGTSAEDAPIVPIAAHYGANIDVLIKTIQEKIPTPPHDPRKPPFMQVARSFDINAPGKKPDDLRGGVLGGSLKQGEFKVGDEIEIRPGVKKKDTYHPVTTKIVGLHAGDQTLDEVRPGGLVAIGTELDPALTKSDNLSGSVIGKPGSLPPVWDELVMDITLFERLIGSKDKEAIKPVAKDEPLMLSVGSAITVGLVTDPKKGVVRLKRPVCAEVGHKVALSRRFGARWRLIGHGIIQG